MSVTGVAATSDSSTANRGKGLEAMTGQDFLKLLISQLVNQDPMEPMKNDELMRQLSSIRELESNNAIADNFKQLLSHQELASASVLVGKNILGVSLDGQWVEGKAERILMDGGTIRLQVQGYEVPLSGVMAVEDTLTGAVTPTNQKMVGDLDEDGLVTSADRALLLKRIAGGNVPGAFKLFDINADTVLDANDVVTIERLMVDVNGDGQVTIADEDLLQTRISGRDVAGEFAKFDINGDGKVDATDLEVLRAVRSAM